MTCPAKMVRQASRQHAVCSGCSLHTIKSAINTSVMWDAAPLTSLNLLA